MFYLKGSTIFLSLIAFLQSSVIIYGLQIEKPSTLKRLDNGKFSVLIPGGWEEIPKSVLDQYSASIKQETGNENVPQYNYGFQLVNEEWLIHPYILIQSENSVRISESDLKEMDTISKHFVDSAKETEREYSKIISKVDIGKLVYDPINNVIWSKLKAQLPTSEFILALMGIIPHEKGTLNIYCYSTERDFSTYSSLFNKFITNIQISPEIEYKPKSMFESIMAGKFFTRFIAYSIVGIFIALISYLRSRMRKKDVLKT